MKRFSLVWACSDWQVNLSKSASRSKTLLQHTILSLPVVFGHVAFICIVSAGNKLICIQVLNNSAAPKIVKDKSAWEDKVKIIWVLYIFCGLNQPWQSSHQSPHFKIVFLFPTCQSQHASHIYKHTYKYILRNAHTVIPNYNTKTPHSAPLTSTPHFNFKMSLFLWSCHKVITPQSSQRKRNRLRWGETDTENEWEWKSVTEKDVTHTPLLFLNKSHGTNWLTPLPRSTLKNRR